MIEAERLTRIESLLEHLLEQRIAKEWYSTAEVAKTLNRAEYTVREWCREGRVSARKTQNGRGWLIGHEELERLRNHGLGSKPLQQNQSRSGRLH